MASLMAGFARSVVANSSSALSQALAIDRGTALKVGKVVRGGVKRHWKKAVVVGTCGALIAGAYKVHCDLVAWREQQDLALDGDNLTLLEELHSVSVVSSETVQSNLSAIGCEAEESDFVELEDVLEVCKPALECLQVITEAPGEKDTEQQIRVEKLKSEAKERKRIIPGKYGVALKSLVNKAKLAFPIPKNSELHIQAVNLYLHKECRKAHLRVSDASRLIPHAVALAIVPSDSQVLLGQFSGLQSTQRRHLQRQWVQSNPSMSVRVVQAIRNMSK